MATVAVAIGQAAEPKTLDASLWWDSFCDLLTQLERISFSEDVPPSLAKKLKDNGKWLSEAIALFKPPNSMSKMALNSSSVKIGSHSVNIRAELRNAALELSSCLGLDELQSYLLISRFFDSNNVPEVDKVGELTHLVLVSYYQERQCLLKCIRQILMLALSIPIGLKERSTFVESAQRLIRGGLEENMFYTVAGLVSSKHPEPMGVELINLWAEETLVEATLSLEILFLLYYEPFSECNAKRWKDLCLLFRDILSGSRDLGMLIVSTEAAVSLSDVKLQLFLILVETLELDNLLQMVHNEVPFRKGQCTFSCRELLEMDGIISSLIAAESVEAGPLFLAWATFLCLVSSLPETEDSSQIMDIDHVGYVRQAFEAGALKFFLEILCSSTLKDSDAVVTGYRSVLKTCISAFIASYDLEDSARNIIVDILQEIYRGQEALCMQFWDKGDFVDGPIRCLLLSLQDEFPQHTTKLVHLLSALCAGAWSAECVYQYLNKMVTLTISFEIPDSYSPKRFLTVEAQRPISVPQVEGLVIPSGTMGQVLKVLNDNVALVRWEFMQSGLLVMLLQLASVFHTEDYEKAFAVLDLLYRLIISNKDVAVSLMEIGKSVPLQTSHTDGHLNKNLRLDLVKIICNMVDVLPSRVRDGPVLSLCIRILTKFLKCSPTRVLSEAFNTKIFELGLTSSSSGLWFLAGGSAKIGSVPLYQALESCTLIISVLDFSMQLVEIGVEDEASSLFILFCLRYALVNHEQWKHNKKDRYWKVKLKVLEVLKNCLALKDRRKLGSVIQDILLDDSSMNGVLQVITADTLEKLHLNRLYKPKEIKELQQIICLVLDIICLMLTGLHKESDRVPFFHQALMRATTKRDSVVAAVLSLISFSRNPALQLAAAKVLSKLCMLGEKAYPHSVGILSFISNDIQVEHLSFSISDIISSEMPENKDLFVSIVEVLIASATYQPPLLLSLFFYGEGAGEAFGNDETDQPEDKPGEHDSPSLLRPRESGRLIDSLLKYIERAPDLIKSDPESLLRVLHFLRVLWRGGTQFTNIVEMLKGSKMFWNNLSALSITSLNQPSSGKISDDGNLHLAYVYHCQSAALEIMACDALWKQKLLNSDASKDIGASADGKNGSTVKSLTNSNNHNSPNLEDIISDWHKESTIYRMIKSSVPCLYDRNTIRQATVAGSLCIVHLIVKWLAGDVGSLSLTAVNMVQVIAKKLSEQSVFLDLVAQHSVHGCGPMHDLRSQIFNDLCHHIHDELNKLQFPSGQLKELSQFLLQLDPWQLYKPRHSALVAPPGLTNYLFDTISLRADMGLDFWLTSEWRKLKTVAENMLSCMEHANLMALLADSQVVKLKSLTLLLSTSTESLTETRPATHDQGSLQLLESSIDHLCKCLQKADISDYGTDTMEQNILEAQTEILLLLVSNLYSQYSPSSNKKHALSLCLLIIKSAASNLKAIIDVKSFCVRPTKVVKHLLTLILLSVEYIKSVVSENLSAFADDVAAEMTMVSLRVLPVLCSAVGNADYCDLSLAALDVILSGILAASTWLPVLRGHLPLQQIMELLQQVHSVASVDVILKFLLTLARVKGGTEMLVQSEFPSYLKILLNLSLEENQHLPISGIENGFLRTSEQKRYKHVWELGMAILAAMVNSLGEDASSEMIVEEAASYLFLEKPHLMSFLSALNFPPNDRDKKRARIQKPQTSLLSLRETEHALILICELSKHRTWLKVMRTSNSQLRERIIHLLAFISKEPQLLGKSPNKFAPFFCPPTLKEEREFCKRPSSVHSKCGWFSLAASCVPKDTVIGLPGSKVPTIQGKADENTGSGQYTYFSYLTAVQIYKIAVLILEFLCTQATAAAKSAEDVGVIDFAHFPELPMPEILHGLQDQAVAIVTELLESNRTTTVTSDVQKVCHLMMQIMEKALYLELCVSQTCGMKPVSARVEDFFKEIKALVKASEGHEFIEPLMKCVKQIIVLVYPDLLQMDGISWS